jgi:hypothetical protein
VRDHCDDVPSPLESKFCVSERVVRCAQRTPSSSGLASTALQLKTLGLGMEAIRLAPCRGGLAQRQRTERSASSGGEHVIWTVDRIL